jgi:16S rRNA G966 N2-methylase RsmD
MWRVQSADLPRDLARLGREGAWSLVFADPPYAFPDHPSLIKGVDLLLARDGVLAVEHSTREHPPQQGGSLLAIDRREYGESALTFYRRG